MLTPASKLAGDPEMWGTECGDEEKRREGRVGEAHGGFSESKED
jgi:hypothetical protein